MYRVLISLTLLSLLTKLSSCFCPDDVVLGQISLQGKDIWPFKGQEEFTFVNRFEDELDFKGLEENSIQVLPTILMERTCTKLHLDHQDAYYNSEHLSFQYHLNTSVFLSYHYIVRNEVEAPTTWVDTVLFETLDVRLVDVSWTVAPATNNFVYLLVSDRRNILSNETRSINDDIRMIADTTINGMHYKDLICHRRNPGLFYSSDHGVVLFRYNDEWWHLTP